MVYSIFNDSFYEWIAMQYQGETRRKDWDTDTFFSGRLVGTKTTIESKARHSFCRQTEKEMLASQLELVTSCYAGQKIQPQTFNPFQGHRWPQFNSLNKIWNKTFNIPNQFLCLEENPQERNT